jgi:UDP-N-acetyl-D-glucosamine dehydrogenase
MTLIADPPESVVLNSSLVARTTLAERPGESAVFTADVAIVGLGYVGLPTALAFHAAGQRVIGIDRSELRLIAIRDENVDLLDSDLTRLKAAQTDDRFVLSADPGALSQAACVIICVPTPVDAYMIPDLAILRSACANVVLHAVAGQVLLLTSTTYVGSTHDMLVAPLADRGLMAGQDIFVAFSPERIDPGNDRHAHEDVPRVVGGVTVECSLHAQLALSSYVRSVHLVSSPEAAEMSKLLENTFRAVNIAMVNEFAEASRMLRLNVMEVINAAATKPYGYMPFTPGPGVGGHCIPCDPHYLLWQLRKHRLVTPLIEQAMESIAGRPNRVVERVREVLSRVGKPLTGAHIMILGVAYKRDVGDLRESPALEVAGGLIAAGAIVSYHDPLIPSMTLSGGQVLSTVAQPDTAAADLVVAHTLHSCFEPELIERASLVLDATYSLTPGPNLLAL